MKKFIAVIALAIMSSVSNAGILNTALNGETVTISWDDTGASRYWLFVGTESGFQDIYSSGSLDGSVTSHEIGVFPADGSTVYIRLWENFGSWTSSDFTYVSEPENTGGGGGDGDGVTLDAVTIENIADTNETINQLLVLAMGAGLVISFAKGFQSGLAR